MSDGGGVYDGGVVGDSVGVCDGGGVSYGDGECGVEDDDELGGMMFITDFMLFEGF